MVYGRVYYGGSILAQKKFLRLYENQEITFLGWYYDNKKYFFPHGSFSIRDGS
jgi:hypothetical protein